MIYPGSATTHSIRSGRSDALLAELSRLDHYSQCEIRQARHSTKWSILALPPLTVWDQAGQMLYRLSYPGLTTTHSVRSGRPDTTKWSILARPPVTVWNQAGLMLYRLSYRGLAFVLHNIPLWLNVFVLYNVLLALLMSPLWVNVFVLCNALLALLMSPLWLNVFVLRNIPLAPLMSLNMKCQ